MDKFSKKEKIIFKAGVFLSISVIIYTMYEMVNGNSDVGVVENFGLSIFIIGAALQPKMFTMPITKAMKEPGPVIFGSRTTCDLLVILGLMVIGLV
jgi:hypothetical protein